MTANNLPTKFIEKSQRRMLGFLYNQLKLSILALILTFLFFPALKSERHIQLTFSLFAWEFFTLWLSQSWFALHLICIIYKVINKSLRPLSCNNHICFCFCFVLFFFHYLVSYEIVTAFGYCIRYYFHMIYGQSIFIIAKLSSHCQSILQ